MAVHVLKTLPDYWDAVDRGDKAFEVRRDDRGFQRGDILVLRRLHKDWVDGKIKEEKRTVAQGRAEYRELRRRVTYILTGGQLGIEAGYVVMALEPDTETARG